MFERFTKPAREVVVAAQEAARRLGDDHVGDEHLLLGLLAGGAGNGGGAAKGLAGLGGTPAGGPRGGAARGGGLAREATRRRVEETFGAGALERVPRRRRGHLPFDRSAKG